MVDKPRFGVTYFWVMSIKGTCICPACGKDLAPKGINAHTISCSKWVALYGAPFPYFKFSRNLDLYQSSSVEGTAYIQCKECLSYGWDFRFKRMVDHLSGVHNLDEYTYLLRYPLTTVRIESTLAKRKATVVERFGAENVFQVASVKNKSRNTMQKRYGGANPMQSEVLKARIAVTNLERYGAENPFASQEIQGRIRRSNLERYGVENPNQSPEVMDQRIQTNLERYGEEHYFETPKFKEKFKETSLKNFGTEHPMQSEKGQELWEQGCTDKFGVPNPLLVKGIHAKSQETSRANHGGVHHLSSPVIIEARKKHLMELYGVDNISKVPSIKEKIVTILKSTWGNGAVPKMNNLERSVSRLLPENVIYTGDWYYWVTWKDGRRKNPDFVVLTVEQLAAYKSGVSLNDLRTYLVIEVNGDFWHTSHKGLTREERVKEFLDGYASVGISCLIIWESDLKASTESIRKKAEEFVSKLK